MRDQPRQNRACARSLNTIDRREEGGAAGVASAGSGSGLGPTLFLQGNQTATLAPSAGSTLTINTRLIGDGDVSALLRTQPNLRYACLILRHYLDQERGDLTLALGRYNGTRGETSYPERVLQAAARWRAIHEAG